MDMVNKHLLHIGYFILLCAFLLAPTLTRATSHETNPAATTPAPATGDLRRDGIFGCSASKYQNVGSLSAIGGVYVPVNDAAVTLNTGYLVYKECVLDGVIAAVKEGATAELVRAEIKALTTARNGNPQYVVNLNQELGENADATFAAEINSNNAAVMCTPFQNKARTAIARSYWNNTRKTNSAYACSLPGDAAAQQAFITGDFSKGGIAGLLKLADPANNPLGAYYERQDEIHATLVRSDAILREQLQYANGIYPQFDQNPDPLARRVVTPGFIIGQTAQQLLGSGFRQLENATEIDQIVGSLFSGLATRVLTDKGGLSGLTKASNGQAPYIDRLVAEANARVRDAATNAALSTIGPARVIEALYKEVKEKTASSLTVQINRLRSAEALCWTQVQSKTVTYAQNNGYAPLKVSTTTYRFAQQIIDAQITPIATSTVAEINKSAAVLAKLDGIIARLSNSSLATAQGIALNEFDQIVASGTLHTKDDYDRADALYKNVEGQVKNYVDETVTSWGGGAEGTIAWNGSASSTPGWCNYNSEITLKAWADKWKQ